LIYKKRHLFQPFCIGAFDILWSMYTNIDSSFNAVIFFLKDLNFRSTLRVFPFDPCEAMTM